MSSRSHSRLIALILSLAILIGITGYWWSAESDGENTSESNRLSGVESPLAVAGTHRELASDGGPEGAVDEESDPFVEIDALFRRAAPAFQHEFIEIGKVHEERIEIDGSTRVTRRRIAQSPQYPERVFIQETFRLDSTNRWISGNQKLEIADEWIVKIDPSDSEVVETILREEGGSVIDSIQELGLWTLHFSGDTLETRDARLARLKARVGIEEVQPNELIWPTAIPNDPSYASQWEFAWIAAEPAWEILKNSALNDRVNVIATIADTGVNVDHADMHPWVNRGEIAGNGLDDDKNGYIDDIHGYDFYAKTGDVQRSSGHGVGVAFTAGRRGNNGLEKASASWDLDIMAGICFSSSGAGSTSAANSVIYYAIRSGARVINCSFVGGGALTYLSSLNYAEANGVIVVAGAGNNGVDLSVTPMYPVASTQSNVVGVGATTATDELASYSNYGSTAIEVFAPAPSTGTSYATPVVTSIVSMLIADDPNAPATEIIARLIKGVDKKADLAGKSISGGRVNLLKSLRLNTLRRPRDLKAYRLSTGGVRLVWVDQSTAENGFVIERSSTDPNSVNNPDNASEMVWQVVSSSVPANTTFYDLSSAEAEGYFYRVRARGSSHDSARNFVTRVVPVSELVPTIESLNQPVYQIYSRGSAQSIQLAWSDRCTNESEFLVERSENGGVDFYELAHLPANSTSYVDESVSSGVQYVYRLKSLNIGYGTYSAPVTESATAETDPMLAIVPTNIVLTPESATTVRLSWSDLSTGESGYRVLRSSAADGIFATVAELPADTTGFTDLDLSPEAKYYYRVEAFSVFGAATSDSIETSTPALPAVLTQPALSGAVSGPTEVRLEWVDTQSERQSAYVVERALGSDGLFSVVATVSASDRSWSDGALVSETLYRYRVSVTDGVDSVVSNEWTITTPPPPSVLISPQIVLQVIGRSEILLSWVDESERETGFLVERAETPEGPFAPIAFLPADAHSFLDTGLEPGKAYAFRVVVTGTSGMAEIQMSSEVVTATTLTVEEGWRLEYFGTASSEGIGDREADPDGDGWTNLVEYATLQSPIDAQPLIAIPGMTEDHRVTLSFLRRSDPSVSYLVEVTNELEGSWTLLAVLRAGSNQWELIEASAGIEELDVDSGGKKVTVTDLRPMGDTRRFMRLAVESAD